MSGQRLASRELSVVIDPLLRQPGSRRESRHPVRHHLAASQQVEMVGVRDQGTWQGKTSEKYQETRNCLVGLMRQTNQRSQLDWPNASTTIQDPAETSLEAGYRLFRPSRWIDADQRPYWPSSDRGWVDGFRRVRPERRTLSERVRRYQRGAWGQGE